MFFRLCTSQIFLVYSSFWEYDELVADAFSKTICFSKTKVFCCHATCFDADKERDYWIGYWGNKKLLSSFSILKQTLICRKQWSNWNLTWFPYWTIRHHITPCFMDSASYKIRVEHFSNPVDLCGLQHRCASQLFTSNYLLFSISSWSHLTSTSDLCFFYSAHYMSSTYCLGYRCFVHWCLKDIPLQGRVTSKR